MRRTPVRIECVARGPKAASIGLSMGRPNGSTVQRTGAFRRAAALVKILRSRFHIRHRSCDAACLRPTSRPRSDPRSAVRRRARPQICSRGAGALPVRSGRAGYRPRCTVPCQTIDTGRPFRTRNRGRGHSRERRGTESFGRRNPKSVSKKRAVRGIYTEMRAVPRAGR